MDHVVIIGGGFGGLYCAKELANKNVNVTLIDKRILVKNNIMYFIVYNMSKGCFQRYFLRSQTSPTQSTLLYKPSLSLRL